MKNGFTLLEIIVVIAILVTTTSLSIGPLIDFRNAQILSKGASDVLSFVKEARSRTLASKDFSQYGIHFEADDVVLFKGNTFVELDPDNESLSLGSGIEISDISLNGGGSDLVFDRLTGQTGEYGTTTLRLKSDPSKFKNIVISQLGVSEIK